MAECGALVGTTAGVGALGHLVALLGLWCRCVCAAQRKVESGVLPGRSQWGECGGRGSSQQGGGGTPAERASGARGRAWWAWISAWITHAQKEVPVATHSVRITHNVQYVRLGDPDSSGSQRFVPSVTVGTLLQL